MKDSNRTSQIIVNHIINQIENGKFRKGEKIDSERKLALELKVGRSSIREAIRQLNVLGYLETIEKVGTFVSSSYIQMKKNQKIADLIQIAPILDILEVRHLIESNIIELTVDRASEQDILKLKQILGLIRKNENNPLEFYKLDLEFHLRLAKSTQNRVIVELMKVIIERIKSNEKFFIISGIETRKNDILIFELLISAIEKKDKESAINLFRTHLTSVTKVVETFK